VPSTSATAVANVAAMSEFTTAFMTFRLFSASSNQCSDRPRGGQAWMRLSLKA
jgi:hypothetical protein